MKNIALQIIGFALMLLAIRGVIVLFTNDDAGLLSWLSVDNSLLTAIYVIIALCGGYLLVWTQKRTKSK